MWERAYRAPHRTASLYDQRIVTIIGDLLEEGKTYAKFRGLSDGTLYLILRHRFEEKLLNHEPDMIGDFNAEVAALTKENQTLRGSKKELDIVAQTSDERVLLIDVKNQQEKPNHETVADFLEKAALYGSQHPGKTLVLAFLSLGGFTEKAPDLCRQQGIAWTTELQYF